MKKSILMLAMVFAFSTAFTSCREQTGDADNVETVSDDMNNNMNRTDDPSENTRMQEGNNNATNGATGQGGAVQNQDSTRTMQNSNTGNTGTGTGENNNNNR